MSTNFVLIAQAVFLLEHGHTDTHTHTVTDATDHHTHVSVTAGMGNDQHRKCRMGPSSWRQICGKLAA